MHRYWSWIPWIVGVVIFVFVVWNLLGLIGVHDQLYFDDNPSTAKALTKSIEESDGDVDTFVDETNKRLSNTNLSDNDIKRLSEYLDRKFDEAKKLSEDQQEDLLNAILDAVEEADKNDLTRRDIEKIIEKAFASISGAPTPSVTPQPSSTAQATPQANGTPTPAGQPGGNPGSGSQGPSAWTAPQPSGDLNNWPKTVIELAPSETWFHRVFNTRLFNAANNWGGADSWFVSLALGPNAGGSWTSHNNPGQIVYRGTSTKINWCLGVVTTAEYKDQFMVGAPGAAGINVRIAPNSVVTVKGPSGTKSQATSDAGDITIILPDSGVVTICVNYQTAAPTHESLVWWGPYDRSENINTIDAR